MAFLSDADIDACIALADETARLYVGVAEHQALPSLCLLRQHLETELSDQFGDEVAAIVGEAFVTAVMERRAELEATSGPARVMN
jgi:hypothetical protein